MLPRGLDFPSCGMPKVQFKTMRATVKLLRGPYARKYALLYELYQTALTVHYPLIKSLPLH